jgi:hypothetical protein
MGASNKYKVIYHPLWDKEKVCKKFNISSDTATMYNTFKVLRSDLSEDGELNANVIKETKKPALNKKNDTETPLDQTSQDDSLVS